MRRFLLIGIVALFFPASAFGAVVQWEENGHYYETVDASLSWPDARTAATSRSYQDLPGHLATITSEQEDAFLINSFNLLLDETWIGGYQEEDALEPAGDWMWVTGVDWGYTNWASPQPDDAGGNEDYLHVWDKPQGLVWNDIGPTNDSLIDRYLVEYEPVPEPSSALLLLGGGLMLASRRRHARS